MLLIMCSIARGFEHYKQVHTIMSLSFGTRHRCYAYLNTVSTPIFVVKYRKGGLHGTYSHLSYATVQSPFSSLTPLQALPIPDIRQTCLNDRNR